MVINFINLFVLYNKLYTYNIVNIYFLLFKYYYVKNRRNLTCITYSCTVTFLLEKPFSVLFLCKT